MELAKGRRDANTTHMSESSASLCNHFLIAMPYMKDPNFSGTLTYICDHNEHGALGLVINRPMEFSLGDILEQLDIESDRLDLPIYGGGPVQLERGFVLHRPQGDWQSSLSLGNELALTTSRDILAAIGAGEGPGEFLVALGYAGWGAGQLEQELAGNIWLTCPADPDILFHTPWQRRFAAAMARMGIDINQLSDSVGHA